MALFLLFSLNCSFALDNTTDTFNSDIGLGSPDANSDALAELGNVIENANPGDVINLNCDYYCSESNISDAIFIFNDVTINGHGHFFDGNDSKISNLFIAYGDNVVLENITFINWNLENYDGVILWEGLNGTIKDCTFKNNYAFGGELIDWVGSDGRLENCNFINTIIESGSAIYWEGVVGQILNCNFLNNTAETGGAIIWKGKNGLIKDSVFTGNAADTGGAIYWDGIAGVLENNYFSDNQAITDGGAVYCEVSDLNLTNCIFKNNNASSEAGAVHLNGGDAKITNCEFINNSASLGGAVFADDTVILEIFNSNFTRNSADYGGAVFVEEELILMQSDFLNNRATYYGGAIYAAYYGNIENSTFIDNVADNGGALTIGVGDIANSKFSKNDAKISGGALFVTEDINIKNSTFEKNTAEDGSDNIACMVDSVNLDNQTSFEGKVCQNVTNVYVDVHNISYGETLDVTVNLYADNKTFNDCLVYAVINNKKYTGNVINNTLIMRISNLDVGNYSTYVIFKNYTGYGGGDRLIFTVDKINAEVDAKYSFVRGINALSLYANILPSNATGTVNFTVNDTDHIAEVKNGTATLYINNLTVGTYYIPVKYSGDSIYKSSYGDMVVTIDKHYAVITAPDVKNIIMVQKDSLLL